MSLKEKLKGKIEPWELELIPRSYDVVGDIAVIRVPEILEHRSSIIAETIMQVDKHVKTVLRQVGPVAGDFRLRGLEFVLGEKKTETVHREFNCLFKVDLRECYFSPRLSHERMRIAGQVKPAEVVVNMFAGVGSFSIIMAKQAKPRKVYSIDISPVAIRFHRENVKLNKVEDIVEPVEADAKRVIEERLTGLADRVLMPLPEKAYEYLDWARAALKSEGGWIHYYGFEHADKDEDPPEKVKDKVSKKLSSLGSRFEIPTARIVRAVGPRWYQIALDIQFQHQKHL